ncbi:MAG: hypothetical protein ACT4ON_10120 [Bacteroidota bacterium]
MKKLFLFLITTIICQSIKGQDTIIKYSSEQIIAKVTEINSNEVKYKRFNFQDGPTYIEEKSNIQLIRYANGLKEEFQKEQPKVIVKENYQASENKTDYYGGPAKPTNKIEYLGSRYQYNKLNINERELHRVLLQSKDKRIISLVGNSKDAYRLQFIGFAAIPLGIGAFSFFAKSISGYFGSIRYNSDLAASGICLIAAIACPIASGIFKHNRTKYNKQAIKIYNEIY